jgi:hypothetical protein
MRRMLIIATALAAIVSQARAQDNAGVANSPPD